MKPMDSTWVDNTLIDNTPGFERLADDFKQAITQLFAHTDKAARLRRMADKMLLDARRLDSNRGMSATTIGFFGPKNAGKSYLLRCLLKNQALKPFVKTGYADSASTEQLVWYGDAAPDDLDPVAEQFHLIDSKADTWLARELVLVDIPGFSDPNTKAVARHSLTSCQLKILVLDASEVEREDAANYGDGFDGAYILPVINRLPGDPDQLDTTDYQATLRNSLRRWAPQATCFDPVLLPHLKHQDVTWSAEQLADALIRAVLDALHALDDLPGEARTQVALRIERFRAEVRRELPEFAEAIQQVSGQIQVATDAISEDTHALIGGERIVRISVRMGMSARLLDSTPAIFFPYRAIQRLLSITSGAWESLSMGLAGSIPSLALTVVKSVRNARDKLDWSTEIEAGLRLRLEQTACEKVLPAFQQLCDVLESQQNKAASGTDQQSCAPTVEVKGVDALMDESRRLFEQTITEHAPPRGMNYLFGGLATLLFIALIFAPLAALYQDYVLTAWNLLQTRQVSLSDFPAFDWGVLFAALLLSTIPVFVLAGLLLALSLSRRRIKRCMVALQTAHKQLINDLMQTGRLRIFTRNSQLEAAQWLGGFLRGR